jgi:hypothetical protein
MASYVGLDSSEVGLPSLSLSLSPSPPLSLSLFSIWGHATCEDKEKMLKREDWADIEIDKAG